MNSTITPFKIHDENSFIFNPSTATAKKSVTKRKGLGPELKRAQFVDSTPQKGGLMTVTKSNRKALSSLSTSQVNSRTPAPSAPSTVINKSSTLNKETQKLSSSIKSFASSGSMKIESFQIHTDDMLCTRMSVEEDPYDFTMRTAAKLSCSISKVPDQDCSYEEFPEYDLDSAFSMKEFGEDIVPSEAGYEDGVAEDQLMEF